MNEFLFYLVTVFITFIETLMMNFPYNIFRCSFVQVVFSLEKCLFFLECKSSYMMSIFIWNLLVVKIYRYRSKWYVDIHGILANFVTTSSASWFNFEGRDTWLLLNLLSWWLGRWTISYWIESYVFIAIIALCSDML